MQAGDLARRLPPVPPSLLLAADGPLEPPELLEVPAQRLGVLERLPVGADRQYLDSEVNPDD